MDSLTLLAAASASQPSGIFDAGTPQASCSLQVTTSGSPSFSVQLLGSADTVTWASIGSAVTTAGTSSLSPSPAARYFQAVLSGFTGPGAVTVLLGFTAGSGYTSSGGGGALSGGYLTVPASAGAPSGTPSVGAGLTALAFDTASNQLWAYNGSWKAVTVS